MTALPRVGLVMSLLLSASCAALTYAPPDAGTDAGAPADAVDAGVVNDAGATDAAATDADPTDAGAPDAPCSADLDTDRMNCGRCGVVCTTPRGTTQNACVAGRCVPTCATSFGDCDSDPVNGCEAELNTESRCGSCTAVCLSNQACHPPPPPDMSGALRCVMCGRRNNACCRAPAQPCEGALRCDGMMCVM